MTKSIENGTVCGDLTVVGKSDKPRYYKCKCQHGHEYNMRYDHLSSKTRCRFCKIEQTHIGEKINGLTILKYVSSDKYYNKYYLVRCFCGKEFKSIYTALKSGHTRSCGCLGNKYGDLSKDSRYKNWKAMIQRTTNPNHKAYKHYHEIIKGTVIDKSWVERPEGFFKEIGEKPKGNYTIDRIDNSKGYIPGNVKWSSKREQQMNRNTKRGETDEKYVYYDHRRDKYCAYGYYPFGRKFLGYFDTINDAKKARNKYMSYY